MSEDPANRPTPHTPPPGLEELPPAMRAQFDAVRAELDATIAPYVFTTSPRLPDLLTVNVEIPRVLLPERLVTERVVPEVLLPPETVATAISEAFARMPVPEVPTPDWVQTPVQGQMLRDINEAVNSYYRERLTASATEPTPAPERDLLDRIDDDLADYETDWELGPDAARRHPDGVYPFPIGPYPAGQPDSRREFSDAEVVEAFAAAGTLVRVVVEGFAAFAEQVGRVAQQLQTIVGRVNEASGYTLAPPPLPQDPRERALAARRTRNTGPPAPPARLPRHHDRRSVR